MPAKTLSKSYIVNVGQLFYSPNMNKWDRVRCKHDALDIPDNGIRLCLKQEFVIVKLVAIEIRAINILVNVSDPGSEVNRKLVCPLRITSNG